MMNPYNKSNSFAMSVNEFPANRREASNETSPPSTVALPVVPSLLYEWEQRAKREHEALIGKALAMYTNPTISKSGLDATTRDQNKIETSSVETIQPGAKDDGVKHSSFGMMEQAHYSKSNIGALLVQLPANQNGAFVATIATEHSNANANETCASPAMVDATKEEVGEHLAAHGLMTLANEASQSRVDELQSITPKPLRLEELKKMYSGKKTKAAPCDIEAMVPPPNKRPRRLSMQAELEMTHDIQNSQNFPPETLSLDEEHTKRRASMPMNVPTNPLRDDSFSQHQNAMGDILQQGNELSSRLTRTKCQNHLHLAVSLDLPVEEVVSILIESPLAASAQDEAGQNALHIAVRYGASVKTVQLLLWFDEWLSRVPDNGGNLPLHLACQFGAATTSSGSDTDLVGCMFRGFWHESPSWSNFKVLKNVAKSFPQALLMKNAMGLTPMDIVANRLSAKRNARRLQCLRK